MGTVFTALLLALLAVAVYFAGRSIRRRKAAAATAPGAAGAPTGLPKVRSAETVPAGTVERSCLYGNAAEARGFQRHDGAVF